jgi:hypothetical protein
LGIQEINRKEATKAKEWKMAAPTTQLKYLYGRPALSDFDPIIGKVGKWNSKTKRVKLRLYDGRLISRLGACIFLRESARKALEFGRGYLLCKVVQIPIVGNPENPRSGSLYTATWHQTYATGYQERHIGGAAHTEIYAIVIESDLVYRPHEYGEISAAIGTLAGEVKGGLCTQELQT